MNRGVGWKWLQSWYVLLPLTFVFNSAAFFYIGARTKTKRWVYWGFFYAATLIVWIVVSETFPETSVIYEIFLVGWFMTAFASIIHALMTIREYLFRLQAVEMAEKHAMMSRIEREYGVRLATDPTVTPKQPFSAYRSPSGPALSTVAPTVITDINTASEETMAHLPGIGIMIAKKAIQFRAQFGGFESVDQFFRELQIKPHIAERIRPQLIASPVTKTPPNHPGGRLVDF